ncbi:MAG TPA: hypothetical protein DCQ31_08130 [Bacteroidales bacterium]|nr:hypothetical protein [Bacteroidales bacterium]
MKQAKKLSDLKIYHETDEVLRLANIGAKEAVERNKKKGIPTPFSIKGKIFYEMPDGTIKPKE